MKTLTTVFLAVFFSVINVYSTDIDVNETGSGGAFTTISAALTAAVDGDRIFIEPKAGGAAYIESLSISKSVQLLSNIEGEKYIVQGDVTVTPSTIENVAIIGMALSGNIFSSVDASPAGRTSVKILFCEIDGNITFNNNNYHLTLANSVVNGVVFFRAGKILGNTITSSTNHCVYVADEDAGGAVHLSDTVQIIGNRIYCNSINYYAINCYSYDYFYQINNNFLYYNARGISIARWPSSLDGTNEILNNTLKRYYSSNTSYAIYCASITIGGVLKMYNNLLDGDAGGTAYCFYFTLMDVGILYISYNYLDSGFDYPYTNVTNDGTNVSGAVFTVDAVTGQPSSGTYSNVGHPDLIYYDHDLTRNDLGCFGGSNSAINYFPIGDTNNARVFDLKIPKAVYLGDPIRVEAEGFDK